MTGGAAEAMFRIKICGVTDPDDAGAAAALGADAVGINFCPSSPRYLRPDRAGPTVRAARAGGATPVAVFVNEDPERIEAICVDLGIDVVQLSGDEPPQAASRLRRRRIKALRVPGAGEMAAWADYPCESFLVDAAVPGAYGGTGKTLDWSRFAGAACAKPWILAGGLDPGNVAEAIRTCRPGGVDVASGVELRPGLKDPEKVRLFIRRAREGFGAGGR